MKRVHLCSITVRIFPVVVFGLFFAGVEHAAPALGNKPSGNSQSPNPKPGLQSKVQKLANPLNDLLAEAQQDIDKSNFEAAIAPLRKVIADQPEFAYAHFQLAYVYTALKKTDEARAEYGRTIAIDPKMSEAYLNLGMMLLDKREDAAAVAPLRKAVELLPAQSRPRYLLAVAQDRSGDRVGAAESFEALLHLDPNDVTAIDYLGWGALRKGKPEEGETRFRRALEIQPNAPEARARLIHLLVEQQQNDAALAELDRLDAGKKPTLESLKLRADIQIAQKKWDDSIATLQQALALSPNDAPLHGGLGRILLQKRDFADAEKELRVALRLDGKNLAYWKDLSTTFSLGGNYPAALATLDEIAKMEPPAAGVWFVRAICYDKLNQPKLALEAYQKFLDLDQDKNPDQVWQAKERSKVLQRMLERKR